MGYGQSKTHIIADTCHVLKIYASKTKSLQSSLRSHILWGWRRIRFWWLLFGNPYRRKFRRQTSDNMDRWKAEQGRGREKREDKRRERVSRKKIQMREKVGKSRFTVFFQWFVAPEVRKVGSLKRRVRSQLARWEMNKCTPLWREARFQVKMYKTQTRSGPLSEVVMLRKMHAIAAWSTFPSQNVQNTRCGPLLTGSDVTSLHFTRLHSTTRHYRVKIDR